MKDARNTGCHLFYLCVVFLGLFLWHSKYLQVGGGGGQMELSRFRYH